MKIYRIIDNYRGKTAWRGTLGEANFVGSLMIADLEQEKGLAIDPAHWVEVDEIKSKAALLNLLNMKSDY